MARLEIKALAIASVARAAEFFFMVYTRPDLMCG